MDLYEIIENEKHIKVLTVYGQDGKIIGLVSDPKNSEADRGMIVLFSTPPSEVNVEVYCVDYEIRTSQRTGKKYVKCFRYTDDISKIERELLEKEINEIVEQLPTEYRDVIKNFLISGKMQKVPDGVLAIFYCCVPFTNLNKPPYIALVTSYGLFEAGLIPKDGVSVISAPGVGVIESYTIPQMLPDIINVDVAGRSFVIVKNEKLASALKKLEDMDIPDDIKEKVILKLISIVRGEEK